MTKKLFTLLSLLVMAAFVLAACTPAATDDTSEEPAGEESSEPAEDTGAEEPMSDEDMENMDNEDMEDMSDEDMGDEEMAAAALGVHFENLEGVTVEFWHVWSGSVGDALQSIVDEFNATNEYGIIVEAYDQGNYGDMFGNVNAAINSGELPDLVVGYNNQYLAWDSAGDIIVNLNDYVADETIGLSEEDIADFYGVFWEQDLIDGERLGIPAQRSGQFMMYNSTWAQELGFEGPPTTPEEFRAQACASIEANNNDDDPNNDGTGGLFLNTGASALAGWIFAFGGEIEADGGYSFNTPEAIDAFTFLKEMYDDGCMWSPENRYPNAEFATRQGLFYITSIAGLPFQVSAFEDAGNTDEWSVVPFPGVTGEPVIDVYGPSFAMVSSTPEEQLASWIFMKYFVESQNQATWIEASAYFPTRASSLDLLDDFGENNPQWAVALELLEYGKFEPRYESWSSVRGALQDAASEMFQEGFDNATIPDLLAELDATAAELHAEAQ